MNEAENGGVSRGAAIRRLREKRLWSRPQLAQNAKVSSSTVIDVEEGKVQVRLSTLGKLAKALEVEPEVLLYPDENQEKIY